MRNNAELRQLAWRRLWADHWFGRLFGGGLLLGLCGYAANVVVGGILGRLGVQTWQDYCMAVLQNRQDLTTPIPNLTNDFIFQATSSSVLSMFIGYIMAGIAAYGTAVILLRCLKNEENGWLGAAFGGFKDPFGMLWLFVRYILIYVGWAVMALLPMCVLAGVCFPVLKPMFGSAPLQAGVLAACAVSLGCGISLAVYCIPFYRYRFLFLVKAEHPDWRAGECIRSCRALMEGHKMASFKLDCSYWKPITLMLLPMLVLSLTIFVSELCLGEGKQGLALVGVVALLCLAVFLPLVLVVPQYISVGQGFLYQDLKDRTIGAPPAPSSSETRRIVPVPERVSS